MPILDQGQILLEYMTMCENFVFSRFFSFLFCTRIKASPVFFLPERVQITWLTSIVIQTYFHAILCGTPYFLYQIQLCVTYTIYFAANKEIQTNTIMRKWGWQPKSSTWYSNLSGMTLSWLSTRYFDSFPWWGYNGIQFILFSIFHNSPKSRARPWLHYYLLHKAGCSDYLWVEKGQQRCTYSPHPWNGGMGVGGWVWVSG